MRCPVRFWLGIGGLYGDEQFKLRYEEDDGDENWINGKKMTLHYSGGGGWQDTSIKHNAC